MTTDTSMVARSHEENWLPILELAVEEVFEIMVGYRVKPVSKAAHAPTAEFTAMVGLAGALCGILTLSCGRKTAREVAKCMLGPEIADSEEQVSDALGEVCNMIAGNFESGSAQMKSVSQPAFDRIATLLVRRNCRVRIEGHTDNIPIHTAQFSSNWELSTSRSTEIVRLLIVRDGFIPTRLSAAGYADYHPIASNATAEGRSMNRRVDIVILGHDTVEVEPLQPSPPTPGPTGPQSSDPTSAAPSAEIKATKPSPLVDRKPVAKTESVGPSQ